MNRRAEDHEGDFYDAVVSELRQPLTCINGEVQRARKLLEEDPPRAGQALDQVLAQIARMDQSLIHLRDRARDAAHAEALFKR